MSKKANSNSAAEEAKKPVPGGDEGQGADEGRFAYEGLDRAMHEKGRLAIMTSLVTHPNGLLFGDLKKMTSLTDGNLSRHLEVLRQAGLIEIWKGFEKKRPQTLARVTKVGRAKFMEYLQELEQVINDARDLEGEDAEGAKGAKGRKLPGGWVPA